MLLFTGSVRISSSGQSSLSKISIEVNLELMGVC
jgi:hypothetical protein